MRLRSAARRGYRLDRAELVLAVALAVVLVLFAVPALAATPSSGTVSETATQVTWTGNSLTPTGGGCGGANNPACDNFLLSIVPPSYPFVVDIKLLPTGDWDLEVYGPDGVLVPGGSSGQPPTLQEEVILNNPPAGTYTVTAVPFAPAPTTPSYTASATVQHGPPLPQPGSEPITYINYVPPSPFGRNGAEPSGGISWKSDKYFAIANTETLRITFDDCSSPAAAQWDDVSYPLTSATTADPILFTDSFTGRTFVSQLAGATSLYAFTDDDGATWTPGQGAGVPSGEDHQTVGGGPFHDPLTRDPNGTLYPNAVYYCSQANVTAFCARSDTGGETFGNGVPLYSLADCAGLHGAVKIAPDGTAYVPNRNCTEQAVIVNDTNNLQPWVVRRVPGSSAGGYHPSVAIAADGTVYLGYGDGDGHPKVAVSHDKGATWPIIADVGIPFGIQNTSFPAIVAGDPDRAAYAFLGTPASGGDPGGSDPSWPGPPAVWHLYVAHTYDGGLTWTTVDATPGDPVQRGSICNKGFGPTGCTGARNLLDFIDADIDRQGRVVVTYADGCGGSCVDGPPNSDTDLLTVARQVNGKRMFAQYDNLDVPAAPLGHAAMDGSNNSLVHLTWSSPDDHGSAITGYQIYRRTDSGSFLLLVSLPASQHAYDDTIDPALGYFYKITASNGEGEGPFCGQLSPTGTEPPRSPCVVPGPDVLTDAQGDYDGTLGSSQYDILAVSMAGAYLTEGPPRLVVTMQMDNLQSPPINSAWRTIWTSPDGTVYWVDMDTFSTGGAITFNHGVVTVVQGNTVFNPVGQADAGSFSADGTIHITIATSKVGTPQPGETLQNIHAESELFIGGGGTGALRTIDGVPGPGSYLLAGCGSQAPDAVDDAAFTPFQTPIVINVLANDSDPQSQPLTVQSVSQPASGTTANNGDGTVTYTPAATFTGTDTFTYTISDPDGFTDAATVSVSVGQCTADPTFGGLQSVSVPSQQTCSLDLSWNPASAHCPAATIRYNVYRSLDPSFVPSPGNAVALRVSGLSYRDAVSLSSGITYYYIVRAEDSTRDNGGTGNGGNEDANLARRSAAPRGPLVPAPDFSDDLEPAPDPGWQLDAAVNSSGPASPTWAATTDTFAHSATHSFFSDNSLDLKDDRLVSPPLNLSSSSHLIFWHRFFLEPTYDGGVLEVSVDGGSNWVDVIAGGGVFEAGAYNDTIDPGFGSPIAGRPAWTGNSTLNAMTEVRVDLGAFAGTGVRLRWRLACDPLASGSIRGPGWYVDDVSVTNVLDPSTCTTPAPPDAGAVEEMLNVSKAAGGEITLSWGPSCVSTDTDYEVYEGTLASNGFYSHSSIFCSTNGETTQALTPAPGSTYYLVVSRNAEREGSYGRASSGAERPQGSSACVQQSIGACSP